jgi:hypothetical protein
MVSNPDGGEGIRDRAAIAQDAEQMQSLRLADRVNVNSSRLISEGAPWVFLIMGAFQVAMGAQSFFQHRRHQSIQQE